MRRGEVYDARLEQTDGSEQGGTRPVIIVSRDAINATSRIVLAVPCTTYPNNGEFTLAKFCSVHRMGTWDKGTLAQIAHEIWRSPADFRRWLYSKLGREPHLNKPPLIH